MPFLNKLGSEHAQKYLKNTLWVFIDFLLRQGINILIGIYLARYLRPVSYGQLGYSMVYVQILTPLALFGLNQITIREIINSKYSIHKIMGTSFWLKVVASVFVFGLTALITYVFESDSYTRMIIWIASFSILFTPFQVIDFYFQANVKSKYIVYSQQIVGIITAGLKLAFIMWELPLLYFVILIAIESILIAISFSLFFISHGGKPLEWSFDMNVCISFLKEAFPVILSSFFIAIYVRADQVIIKHFMGAKELGIYIAAVKLSEPFYAIATILVSSLFPAIVIGLKISKEEYYKRVQMLYNLLTAIAVITCCLITVFASDIISVMYGPDFLESKSVLIIYFWASVFVFQGVIASNSLIVEGKIKYSLIYTTLGVLLNIGLNLLLIPGFGLNGAALATLISYALTSVFFNSIFKETRMVFKQQLRSFMFLKHIRQNIRQLYRIKS